MSKSTELVKVAMEHNHSVRDIKPKGSNCAACEYYWTMEPVWPDAPQYRAPTMVCTCTVVDGQRMQDPKCVVHPVVFEDQR